jgi:hypothetical protein
MHDMWFTDLVFAVFGGIVCADLMDRLIWRLTNNRG